MLVAPALERIGEPQDRLPGIEAPAPLGLTVRGPFLFDGDRKFTVRAVTYGTFAADDEGQLYPPREQIRRDFEGMRTAHVNCVRVYTAPPGYLLEEADRCGLRVLVGIYWGGQDCDFDRPSLLAEAERAVRETVERCRAHAHVVLGYLIGNEIPALVVRYHGRRVVERFLEQLYDVAKRADPGCLVSYGNYPSTEYLQLDFLDFHTFNVYLLDPKTLSAYLDRLLLQGKGKPLLLGEVGDDSSHSSEAAQAELLDWTLPLVLNKGVCGACVFSWTDDWVVGGHVIEDWAFGLVDRSRQPKASLDVVSRRFGQSAVELLDEPWPRISVVVCNYNGADTLGECLRSLVALDYPDYEVIYIDDGSTDDSLEIARRFEDSLRIVAQSNHGLSAARNVGASLATGEIIAYIDSDAYADPDWLCYLALSLSSGTHAAVGGPNLTPASDGFIAQLIALCPGNPTCVLKHNAEAEHIAGVNMAFRRDALLSVGCFDPVHRAAGDDVDICWRLMDAGYQIGFCATAIVWHHRRPSIRRYLRQQHGYGEAENQLERKHPERFNLGGYIRWAGRVYSAPRSVSSLLRPFIYHGRLGEGLFQTLYQKEPSFLLDGPLMIQWYVLWIVMLALTPVSSWFLGVACVLMSFSVGCAIFTGFTVQVPMRITAAQERQKIGVISLLYFLHPVVRAWGRLVARIRTSRWWSSAPNTGWFAPRRLAGELRHFVARTPQSAGFWGLGADQREEFLKQVQSRVKRAQIGVRFGREWDRHDMLLSSSAACEGLLYTSPEHYGQALRFGFAARVTGIARVLMFALVGGIALLAWSEPRFLGLFALPGLLGLGWLAECARLRFRLWQAIGDVAAACEAKPYDRDAS